MITSKMLFNTSWPQLQTKNEETILLIIIIVVVCVYSICLYMRVMGHVWRSEDSFVALIFSYLCGA